MQVIQLLSNSVFCLVIVELCILELEEYAGRFDLSSFYINMRQSKGRG